MFLIINLLDFILSYYSFYPLSQDLYRNDQEDGQNVHGGAMWARMPITALVADVPLEEWPTELPPYLAQPWDCMSHDHAVYKIERASPAPWSAKVDGELSAGQQ